MTEIRLPGGVVARAGRADRRSWQSVNTDNCDT
jgi:hypothetical protein